jgi:uncharacterized repeat protein (TIGR01451 family)
LGTGFSPGRALAAGTLLVALGALLWSLGSGVPTLRPTGMSVRPPAFSPDPVSATSRQALSTFRGLPLIFEANQGQSDPRVQFLAHGSGYGLFLAGDEAVLTLSAPSGADRQHSAVTTQHAARRISVVRMKLADGNPNPSITGDQVLPGKSNYLIGNDAAKWHRNIPQFARVRYAQVYPGIDLVYYGQQGQLEYDFEVAPNADPRRIALRFQGSEKLKLDADGDLVLSLDGGEVRLHAPRIYQKIQQEQRVVPGRFVLRAENEVGFEVGAYDRTRALVIDPVLTYSTYLGGSGDEACSVITGTGTFTSGCPAIAVDTASSAYVAGSTNSVDFPVGPPFPPPSCPPPFQCTLNGVANIFIAKFSSSGSALLFATYLGGTGTDTSAGIAVDSGFNVFVAGTTSSGDFPTNGTNAPFQATPKAAGTHAFVSELDSTGGTLLYSTYLSGSATDIASGLAVDVKNKAYVTGTTASTDFPTTTGAFQTASLADTQFFVSKIDPATSGVQSLPYSTYFGGGNPTDGNATGGGIAVDTNSNVYFTGGTSFLHTGSNATTDFPILNAAQGCLDDPTNPPTCPGGVTATDAFVAKINPNAASGAQLLYSTYVGGSADDSGAGIALDSGGNAYITGTTNSEDFPVPTTIAPFQKCLDDPTNPPTCAGGHIAKDAFVMKISNPAQADTDVTFTYGSFLGGSADDSGYAIAADTLQGARVTGSTQSADFPVLNAITGTSYGGGIDAFVARLDTTSTHSLSSFLGGAGTDSGTGIAIDASSATYVAGETNSANFPPASPFQGSLNGGTDAFVTKVGPSVNFTMDAEASPVPAGVGNEVTFTYTITNTGDLTPGVILTDTLPSGATFVSATSSPGSCGDPAGTPPTVTCSVGTLDEQGTATVTVIVTPTVAGPLGNSALLSVLGSSFTTSASASTTVNDFNVSRAPASVSVAAGATASYTVTVSPSPTYPDSVSLSCSSGLPAESRCAFSTTPLPGPIDGPVTSALSVSTTIRPVAMNRMRSSGGIFYATWLPIGGLALLGAGIGRSSRRRRWLGGLLLGGVLGLMLFQAACGSNKNPATPTGGTPAGSYIVTVTASSGSATRTTSLTLVVQ